MNLLKTPSFLFSRNSLSIKKGLIPYAPTHKPLFLNHLVRRNFSQSASWANKGNGPQVTYTAIITRGETKLASSAGWDNAQSIEDKYNLSKIHDVKKIFSILRQASYKFPLNDMVHFLRRIVELNDEKETKTTVQNSTELNTFIHEIKHNLRHATQEYPLIGSYAWCFWKLDYLEDSELWLTLGDHIIDGRFTPNFKEVMCGIEGFTALRGVAEQEFIDEVYNRLERILVLTIMEVSIHHYKRISESLVKVQRFTQYVFENIEVHLMHFLASHELKYDLKLMLDILSCFAIGGNGSERLYYSFQQIFTNFSTLTSEEMQSLKCGEFIAKLIQTYSLAKLKHAELAYDPAFSKLVHYLVVGVDAEYNLEQLVDVVQHIPLFGFEDIDEINALLDKRLFSVKGFMKGDDMVRYIDMKILRDYEEDYSKLPKEIMNLFDSYLTQNIDSQTTGSIYYYISELELRNLMEGRNELMNKIIIFVSDRLHIYDFEALCYFFWLFNKYNTLIHMDSPRIQCCLSQIKDHIRLYSAFSKGRLRIGSNFYKMLEVVSGSDFLTQGEYPEW